jgi:hypothetical protein
MLFETRIAGEEHVVTIDAGKRRTSCRTNEKKLAPATLFY